MRGGRSGTRSQSRYWLNVWHIIPYCSEVWSKGMIARIKIQRIKVSTPLSLFGMNQTIVYVNKNYHSFLMWGGVFRGLTGL